MKLNRSKIADMRSAIYKSEHNGAPEKVFAQISSGGTWSPVKEIKVVGGIIWVRLSKNGGMYMSHDIRLME